MRSYRARIVATFAAVMMAVTLMPFAESTVSAAPPSQAPSGLSPAVGETVSANPQLNWSSVPDATTYRIQISDDAGFSSLLVNDTTYNTTYTPTAELPTGTIHWRVAARNGSDQGPWATSDLEKGLAGPVLLAPGNDDIIDYATDATTLSWEPTPSARSYVLEIDDDAQFVGATRIVTRSTSHTPTAPLSPGQDYYWRVRGSSATNGGGVLTSWSEIRLFEQTWTSQPAMGLPANGHTVTDIELEWEPVPGAVYYNVEVDPSQEFSNPTLRVTNSRNTTLTPARPLDNAAYWWRVQAVDAGGNLGTWSEPRLFFRNWVSAPTLLMPDANAVTSGPLRFEWRGVDHASRYTIEISNNQFFTAAVTDSCTTRQTAIYLGSNSVNCRASRTDLSQPFFWRVKGIDDPQAINGVYSETRRHGGHTPEGVAPGAFEPGVPVQQVIPATLTSACRNDPQANERHDCTYNATPTFWWLPSPEADRYVVRIAHDPNFTTVVRTYTLGAETVFTPDAELPDSDAGASYYWHVQPCQGTGNCGPSPVGQNPALPSFEFKKVSARVNLVAPANGSEVADAPRFEWEDYLETTSGDVADPAPGTTDIAAREYQIQVSVTPTFASRVDDRAVDSTFYTAWDRTYPEGPLYWRVRARDGSNNWLAWSQTGQFTKSSPAPMPIAPLGATSGPTHFRWERVDGARDYQVEVFGGGDRHFSPANRVLSVTTAQFEHTVTALLPPGDYTWRIRRRDANSLYGAWSHEPDSADVPVFSVHAAVPSLDSPSDGELISGDDLLFTWNPVAGASHYRFQRSTTVGFTAGVSNYNTVMTSYAPLTQWSNGTYWWRVVAFDASNNEIGTSLGRRMVKDELPPAPTGVSAGRGDTSATVSWAPSPAGGGTAITGYTVYPYIGTARQAPRQAPAGATSLLVTGLTNGTAYTFRVAANNAGGTGPESQASNSVTPSPGPALPPGSVYVPVTPCRIVDTRNRVGAFAPNVQRNYHVTTNSTAIANQGGSVGGCGIPSDAEAAELSVTAVNPSGTGFFRAWPTGEAMPNATFLNYTRGQSVTNTGAVKLRGPAGPNLTVRNHSATSHYVIEVQGYYVDGTTGAVPGGSVYVPITPCRIVDTRNRGGVYRPNVQRNYRVTGTGSAFANQGGASGGCGIPTGATAIEGSVSAVTPGGNGYFRAWPTGEAVPNATFLNYTRDQGITNTGAIKLATSGTNHLTVRNYSATSHYVIDVQGYFVPVADASVPPGSVYVPITPCRIVDTRNRGGVYRPNVQRNYRVTGTGSAFASQGGASGGCGIPTGATAIEGSVSAVTPGGNGYTRAWPTGEPVPNATFLNYTRDQGITNTGAIKLATSGSSQLTLRNYSSESDYVIDVQGYYLTD